MLTTFDKAIVPLIVSGLAYINQRYGLHFNADPATVGSVIAAVTAIAVYFIPNK